MVDQAPAFLSLLKIGVYIFFPGLLSVSPLDIKLHQGQDYVLSS